MKVASLFAGVGGICMGFKNNGFEVVWSNDADAKASETYRENFSHSHVISKIEEVNTADIPDVDVVTSGFPCTSFSIAGYRKGFEDENSGHLFLETLRIIKAKRPKIIFLENVKNLVAHDGGKTFEIIKDALQQNGYHIKYKVLNSCEYGNVPQNRERIYIVGFLDKESCERFSFPQKVERSNKVSDVTNPSEKKDEKYYYRKQRKRGKTIKDCIYYPELVKVMKNKETVYQIRRVYIRENKKNLCPTLTANMGTGGHNVPLVIDDHGFRKLTPRECFLMQGFPPTYKFPSKIADCHLYKQAGNSVTVTVVDSIVKQIKKAIKK